MYHILIVILLLLGCSTTAGFAQTRREEWMMQKVIDTPGTLSLDRFLVKYFQYGCYQHDYRINENEPSWWFGFCEEGRDEKYAYWSHIDKMHAFKYKILLSDLDRIKFGHWDAKVIKNELFSRTIAERDRERPGDPFICNATPSQAEYSVTYIPNINAIRVDLHWKIYCEIIFKLVNQKRCAIYDFDTGTFSEIDPIR